MSYKKDMRRADLAVPYVELKEKNEPDMAGTMASTLPMVAIVTRNKMLGWVAILFALQSWLVETPTQKRNSPTPAYFTVMMSTMSLAMSYLPMFMPQLTLGGNKAAAK